MDIAVLAAGVVELLHPYLGVLLKAGVGAVAKGVGEDVWKGVKTVWTKLAPAIAANPELSAAAHDAAQQPQNSDNVDAFREALRKHLEGNPQLVDALQSISSSSNHFIVSTHDKYEEINVNHSSGTQIGPRIGGSYGEKS